MPAYKHKVLLSANQRNRLKALRRSGDKFLHRKLARAPYAAFGRSKTVLS